MSRFKKIRFIVNPFSGVGNKSDFQDLLAQYFDSQDKELDIVYTERAGHAVELSTEAVVQSYDLVVAVGGDGTVNEVASQLLHSSCTLAILPAGSGNGFALHIGMGRNMKKALRKLSSLDSVTTIDTAIVNGGFFINVSGIGFDAMVSHAVKAEKRRGLQLYVKKTIECMRSFEILDMHIQLDDRVIEGKYVNAIVANASLYGYHLSIAPQALLTDGLLDLILIKNVSKASYLLSAYRLFNKTFHQSRLVDTYVSSSIEISVNKASYVHRDGEGYLGDLSYTYKIHPASLKVLMGT